MNAVNFIRQSSFYTSPKYARLHSIVDKVLSDGLGDEDLTEFVDAIAPMDAVKPQEVTAIPAVPQRSSGKTTGSDEARTYKIKAIKEIRQASNIGLIGQTPPIELGQGLTVFYGHNASGKTSLYKAISNCLGLADHAIANVNIEAAEPARAELVVEDSAGNAFDLTWPSDEAHKRGAIKCFDSAVSISLVRDAQQNTFALAHLKQEYFALLGDTLDSLALQLDRRKQSITKRLDESLKMIQVSAPLLSDALPSLTEAQLENASISGEEREHLGNLEAKLAQLEKEDLPAKLTVFANDIARIDEILSSVATRKDDEGESVTTWELTYNAAYLQQLRELINTLNQYDATLRDRASTLGGSLPSQWVENKLWLQFVNAALEFVYSLESSEQNEYRGQKCPYCQQRLTSESRTLLAAYEALHTDITKGRDATEASITCALRAAETAIKKVKRVSYIEALISDDTKAARGDEAFHLPRVLVALTDLQQSLLTRSPFFLESEELDNINSFYDHYFDLRKEASAKRDSYKALSKNKETEAISLRAQIAPVRHRRLLVDNKESLGAYLALRKTLAELMQVRTLLTDAKRQISTIATEFSNQITVQAFQKILDREYGNLGFEKPAKFRLACKSAAGTTKRVYSIADKGFQEILSEGEQKQHALADFFAQIEAEGYTGLVIFDDPVTSLDECNIEKVARRIVALSEQEDDQVILFTHNIFFLNSLIEITGKDKVMHMSKTGSEITVHPEVQLGSAGALKRWRKTVEEKIAEIRPKAVVQEMVIRNIYDMLSNYVETAVEVILLKEVVGRYRPNIRIQSLRNIHWDDAAVPRLVELYNRTSRKGTRHSQPGPVPPPTEAELVEDAKEVFDAIDAL